jgi:hypothetical protein
MNMNWKCPICGNEDNLNSELKCSCGNEIAENQLQQLQFEKIYKKPRTSPSLRNAFIVIVISIATFAVALPFTKLLSSTANSLISHQASIIGYLFVLRYRIKDNPLQIWKVGIWVWLLLASFYSLAFYHEIGTKYTARGIIWGGLKSEIFSVIVALLLYGLVKGIKRIAHNNSKRFWKIYFVFIVILTAISLPFYMKTFRTWEVIDIVFMIPAMVGLFGFVWKKQILKQEFWKVFFISWVSWTPLYHFIIPLPSEALKADTVVFPQWLLATLTLIPAIPHFIAIFRYAFPSAEMANQRQDRP